MAQLFANSEDPDQISHTVASDLGLHCLPVTLLGVSRLKWVKEMFVSKFIVLLFMLIRSVSLALV